MRGWEALLLAQALADVAGVVGGTEVVEEGSQVVKRLVAAEFAARVAREACVGLPVLHVPGQRLLDVAGLLAHEHFLVA